MMKCNYCGGEATYQDRIGQQRIDMCDACTPQFDADVRDADRADRDEARRLAEEDDYGRYRGGW